MRIFPEMWASTLWPFSSSTRNIAFGSGSITVPSRTIASSLGLGRTDLRSGSELVLDLGPRGHEPGAGPREETIAGDSQSQLGLTCTNAPDCPPSDDSRPVGSSLLGPRPTEVHG